MLVLQPLAIIAISVTVLVLLFGWMALKVAAAALAVWVIYDSGMFLYGMFFGDDDDDQEPPAPSHIGDMSPSYH